MFTKVFSIYDSKSCAFGVPFCMPSVGAAVRAFSDLCNDPQSMLFRHPADFVLYEVGSFDDSKGLCVPLVPHVHLGLASDFRVESPGVVRAPVARLAEVDSDPHTVTNWKYEDCGCRSFGDQVVKCDKHGGNVECAC